MTGLDVLGAVIVGDAGTGGAPSAPFDTPAQAAARKAEVEAMAERSRQVPPVPPPEGIPAWKWALGGLGLALAGAAVFATAGAHQGASTAASREEAARAHREFHLARGDWA